MLAHACSVALLLLSLGCERSALTVPITPPISQDHQFAVYAANGQTFLIDGKTGDAWIYADTKLGKGFTSIPVLGLGGVTEKYNPKSGKLEPLHQFPSWFHQFPADDPLGLFPEGKPKASDPITIKRDAQGNIIKVE